MKKTISALIATLMIGAAWTGPATAETAKSAVDLKNPEVVGTLNQLEDYLSSITTIKSRFIQANPDGSYVEGTMYMNRPGKARFEYDAPVPILLVATGNFFIHVDKELKQVTHIPLSSTPAYLLLREDINFQDNLEITGFERRNGLIRLSLVERENEDYGEASLIFSESPLELKQWTITDAQQLRTTVTLMNSEEGLELDEDLFHFHNPWDGIGVNDN
ncbi:LolA family protein [Aestuariispira insulae]|uniref:Outer membrane lipoprotein-sorting protein n=1 Tax=Aestuariispira insulae TaxID=1461337 RepID=A0A3D9HP97_9PROT|nr:outer-membrane lipoprotein carrier protein LolA [Aestuariispira insulae]RED51323.1 outer membrane lipoprotein-sorting protein [Aestuariispira insulae]